MDVTTPALEPPKSERSVLSLGQGQGLWGSPGPALRSGVGEGRGERRKAGLILRLTQFKI